MHTVCIEYIVDGEGELDDQVCDNSSVESGSVLFGLFVPHDALSNTDIYNPHFPHAFCG